MAECTISSVTLTPPGAEGRENIGLTTAKVTASCSASLPEAHAENVSAGGSVSWRGWVHTSGSKDSNGNGTLYYRNTGTQSRTRDWISYKDLSYKWTPLPSGDVVNEGSATEELHWTDLTEKSQNAISAQVEVTCTTVKQPQKQSRGVTQDNYEVWENNVLVDDHYYNPVYDSWPSTWSNNGSPTETKPTCSATATSESIDIWTRPNVFEEYDSFAFDLTISQYLTSARVGAWVEHAKKMNHWFTQSNADGSTAGCDAESDAIITAAWYNSCASVCNRFTAATGVSVTSVTGGFNGTVIKAEQFNGGSGLAKGISKDGEV